MKRCLHKAFIGRFVPSTTATISGTKTSWSLASFQQTSLTVLSTKDYWGIIVSKSVQAGRARSWLKKQHRRIFFTRYFISITYNSQTFERQLSLESIIYPSSLDCFTISHHSNVCRIITKATHKCFRNLPTCLCILSLVTKSCRGNDYPTIAYQL